MSVFDLPPRFPIYDHEGHLQAYHGRTDKPDGSKMMPWYRSDGKTMGLAGRSTSSLPMYGTEEVALHPVGQPFIVVEGEKAMWGLSQLGQWPVLGTVTGAGNPVHTPEALSPIAKDRIFILWPDNDTPGRKHMDSLAQNLLFAGAHKISIIDVPTGWPKGFDAWDFIQPETYPEDFTERRAWSDKVIESVRSFVRDRARGVLPLPYGTSSPRIHLRNLGSSGKNHIDAQEFAIRIGAKRQPNGQWKGKCPGHEDRVASLTIMDGEDGKLVLHCHAGCTFVHILDAAGVK